MSRSFAGQWSGTVRHLMRRYRLYNFLIAGYVRALSIPDAWRRPQVTREIYAVMAVMQEAVRANVEAAAGRLPFETGTEVDDTRRPDYCGPASVCNPVVLLLDGLFFLAQEAHEASLAVDRPCRGTLMKPAATSLDDKQAETFMEYTLTSLRDPRLPLSSSKRRIRRRSQLQSCHTPRHHKVHSCLAIWALTVHRIQVNFKSDRV